MQGGGFSVEDLGLRVHVSGPEYHAAVLMQGEGFRVEDLGLRVQGKYHAIRRIRTRERKRAPKLPSVPDHTHKKMRGSGELFINVVSIKITPR